jgi:hypothetical protein
LGKQNLIGGDDNFFRKICAYQFSALNNQNASFLDLKCAVQPAAPSTAGLERI